MVVDRYDFTQKNSNVIYVTARTLDQGTGTQGQIRSGESMWFGRKITVNAPNLEKNIVLNKGSLIDFLKARGFNELNRGFLGIGATDDAEVIKAWNTWTKGKNFSYDATLKPHSKFQNNHPTPLQSNSPSTKELNPRIWDDNPTPFEFLDAPVKNSQEAKSRLNRFAQAFGGSYDVKNSHHGGNPQISFITNDVKGLAGVLNRKSEGQIRLNQNWQKQNGRITLTYSESAILLGYEIKKDNDNADRQTRRLLNELLPR